MLCNLACGCQIPVNVVSLLLAGPVGRPCFAQQYNDWHWVDNGRHKSEQHDLRVYAGEQLAPAISKLDSVVRLIVFSFVSIMVSPFVGLKV